MTAPAERILVVGVDGGGSKTRAVVADATGRTLVTVDGPGSAVRPGEALHAADVIAAVVRDALATVLASGFALDAPPTDGAAARDDGSVAASAVGGAHGGPDDGADRRVRDGDADAPSAAAPAAGEADHAEVPGATDATEVSGASDATDAAEPTAPSTGPSAAGDDEPSAPTPAADEADPTADVVSPIASDAVASHAVASHAVASHAVASDAVADDRASADDAGAVDEPASTVDAFPAPLLVPAVLYVGVAGAGRESEREALRAALAGRGLADEVIVVPDAEIALDDAFGEGPGVMLIAGTGSVAFARGPSGEFRRAGGWGPVIGDEGSGAWIGRRAINVAAASADGREPATALLDALLTAIDADDPAALIPWAAGATPARFAELAPVVLRVAANGDLRANTLLSMAIEELVLHVRTLARGLFVDERASVPVALAGGLLAPRQPLRKRLEQRLRTAVPGAQLRQDEVQPARGAVRAALRQLGVEV